MSQFIDELFESFSSKKVLVIGDVMVDAYMYGQVQRISPEAPVPVLSLEKREQRLGGAANVAMNIQSLGATPILCSVVGDDEEGEAFSRLLRAQNMPAKGIIQSQKRRTTTKHRILSGSQHLLRVDAEDTSPLTDLDQKSLLGHIKNLIAECDLVIFEDYDKGAIDEVVIKETIKLAREKGIPTVVDPKKKNFLKYKGASLFKPNLKELGDGLSLDIEPTDIQALGSAVKTLEEQIAADQYLVTLGSHGMYFEAIKSKQAGILPARVRKIADVSGAGDTVISIAGLALTAKLPLDFIAELANLAGGIVCESPGVTYIDCQQLITEAKKSEILHKFS